MRQVLEDRSDPCVRHTEEVLELRIVVRDLELRSVLASNELRELRRERDAAQKELARVAGDLAVVETQHAALTSLFVAAHQLHGTMDRETVLSRLEEIIVNFVGSEEFGVYEHTRGDELRRIAHVGLRDDVDPRLLQDLLAGIPLEIDEKRVGYIAIHRLLPHKPALEPADLELFNLLKTHAAAALLASRPSHDAQ
ncbi:MAG TPA: hypothetical protein VHU41_04250 [Thermoanaerobaculia bacterium]|nr:hypothetical protein [Thermoanaerobaculia bacterium]